MLPSQQVIEGLGRGRDGQDSLAGISLPSQHVCVGTGFASTGGGREGQDSLARISLPSQHVCVGSRSASSSSSMSELQSTAAAAARLEWVVPSQAEYLAGVLVEVLVGVLTGC